MVGCDRPICFDDLPNLKYTERALWETLRLVPVIPLFGRKATADLDLSNKVIPKGTNIIFPIIELHRNEKYWPDPLTFDPDRFLPERSNNRDPYTFLPFSGGPRNCIGTAHGHFLVRYWNVAFRFLGKTYSMMQMKTCAATIARNYRIFSPYKSVTDLKLTSTVTLSTIFPLDCQFQPRMHD